MAPRAPSEPLSSVPVYPCEEDSVTDAFTTFLSRKAYKQQQKNANKAVNSNPHTESASYTNKISTIPKQRPTLGETNPPTQTVPRRIPSVKIFVGGLHPDTKREDIIQLINKELSISVGCFQLRTRYPTYSSFCITTEEEYEDFLLCSNMWPPRAKIMHFRGRRQTKPNSDVNNRAPTHPQEASNHCAPMEKSKVNPHEKNNKTDFQNVTVRHKNKKKNWAAEASEEDDLNVSLHLSESETGNESDSETSAQPASLIESETKPTEEATDNLSVLT
jgi:hypothetical protein